MRERKMRFLISLPCSIRRSWLPFASVAIRFTVATVAFIIGLAPIPSPAQHKLENDASSGKAKANTSAASARKEAELAIKNFEIAKPLKVDLWAAEPLLVNPVAFNFDEQGRAYVCETFRLGAGVDDIRHLMSWLNEDLACRTVDDRLAEMKRHLGELFTGYSQQSERIRL